MYNPASGYAEIWAGQPDPKPVDVDPASGSTEISAGQPDPKPADGDANDSVGSVSAWCHQFEMGCGSRLWSASRQATAGCTAVADGRTANLTGQRAATMSPVRSPTEGTVSPLGSSGGNAGGGMVPEPATPCTSAVGTPRLSVDDRQIVALATNPSDTPLNLQAMSAAQGGGRVWEQGELWRGLPPFFCRLT